MFYNFIIIIIIILSALIYYLLKNCFVFQNYFKPYKKTFAKIHLKFNITIYITNI
jgi:hypothetical protein